MDLTRINIERLEDSFTLSNYSLFDKVSMSGILDKTIVHKKSLLENIIRNHN